MSAPPLVALAECCEVVGGGTPRTSDPGSWDGEIAWATPKDVSELAERYIGATARNITSEGLRRSGARVLPPGSVLLSSRAPIGLVAINTVPMATNQGFKSLIPDTARADARYLAHWLGANTARLQGLGNGATFKEVSKSIVSKVQVPLPPLAEQRRVAQVLDTADGLRARRQGASRQLEKLAQSVFAEMFGDPVVDEHGYGTRPLVDLVDPERPITYGILKPGEDLPGGVRYVRVVDMVGCGIRVSGLRRTSEEIARAYRRSTLAEGDVLMSIRGHVGRMASVPAELVGANITQDSARLAVPRESARYVTESLRAPGIQRWMAKHTKGAAVRGLNLGDVKRIPVLDAPLDMQLRFSEKAVLVDRLVASARNELVHLDTLFASLQSRAFAGDL